MYASQIFLKQHTNKRRITRHKPERIKFQLEFRSWELRQDFKNACGRESREARHLVGMNEKINELIERYVTEGKNAGKIH